MLVYQLLSSYCDKMLNRTNLKKGKVYFSSECQRHFSLSWLERCGKVHGGMGLVETPHT